MGDQQTFTCEACSRVLPRYVDGVHQPSCGMNLGWGVLEWCRDCRPAGGSVEEIVRDFEDFMFPRQE